MRQLEHENIQLALVVVAVFNLPELDSSHANMLFFLSLTTEGEILAAAS